MVGAIALILALYALQFLPLSYAGLSLIILGLLFMLGEALVPSFGILGIGGVIAFIFGSLFLFDINQPAFQLAKSLIIAVALVNAAFFILVGRMALKALKTQPQNSLQGLLNQTGVCSGKINPKGQVKVAGEFWQATSAEIIQVGEAVTVIDIKGMQLVVKSKQ